MLGIGINAVSYTHLDVYKRQIDGRLVNDQRARHQVAQSLCLAIDENHQEPDEPHRPERIDGAGEIAQEDIDPAHRRTIDLDHAQMQQSLARRLAVPKPLEQIEDVYKRQSQRRARALAAAGMALRCRCA